MTVNHGGTLGIDFFVAYIKLIMNSRGCSLEEAKAITLDLFFNRNENQFGKQTYNHFLLAFEKITDIQ